MKWLNQLISETVALEFEMLHRAQNCNPVLSSAYNELVFCNVRSSQLRAWTRPMLESYQQDIHHANEQERNLFCERYAYLMLQLDPEKYPGLQERVPKASIEKMWLVDWICSARAAWWTDIGRQQRDAKTLMWSIYKDAANLDGDACLRSELLTYSVETLRLYAAHIETMQKEQRSIDQLILDHTLTACGYASLNEAVRGLAAGL